MILETSREQLLSALQAIIGAVERRQTNPILGHVLISFNTERFMLTATDNELELSCTIPHQNTDVGDFTLPARKLADILKALPEGSPIRIEADIEAGRAELRSGRSKFILSLLPAADFPSIESSSSELEFTLPRATVRRMLSQTHFSMAVQDSRFFLNGLMFEVSADRLTAVSTDGHRLSLAQTLCETALNADQTRQIIIPRKTVAELIRLLDDSDAPLALRLSAHHMAVEIGDVSLVSKLIDSRYPAYDHIFPSEGGHIIVADRNALQTALTRVAILSSEKYRSVRIRGEGWLMQLLSNNPEHEEAEEEIDITLTGDSFEVAYNIAYLQDALSALDSELVRLSFASPESGCLVQKGDTNETDENQVQKYVIMPMKL